MQVSSAYSKYYSSLPTCLQKHHFYVSNTNLSKYGDYQDLGYIEL